MLPVHREPCEPQVFKQDSPATRLQAGAASGRLAAMPRRNSPNDIRDLSDLSRLAELVVDKRQGQRAAAKKNRRNRHYEKQFIRNTMAHLPGGEPVADPGADPA